jgi:DNA transposition AAA+ family ATPase
LVNSKLCSKEIKMQIARSKNVLSLLKLYQSLDGSPAHVPRMGLVLGSPGAGKTTAVTFLANQTNCAVVECSPCWTLSSMLRSIAHELSMPDARSNQEFLELIAKQLRQTRRGIVFDETDERLFQGGAKHRVLIDAVRALYDRSNVPFIFVGYQETARTIRALPQLEGRISQQADFQPLDLQDTQKFIELYKRVVFAPELVEALHAATQGRPRQTVTAIEAVNNAARERGLAEINLEQWGREPFFPGDKRK